MGLEEIDSLQAQQETLLAAVAKRMRILENEIQILNNWQDGKVVSKDSPSPATSKGKGSGKGTASTVVI